MSTKPKTAHYEVANTSPGPRFVMSAAGKAVTLEKGETRTVELTEAEAKSVKTRGDLTLSEATASATADDTATQTQAPGAPNGGQPGAGGSADGREQTGTETDPAAPAYVAHEGLGRWFVYNAEGVKLAVDGATEPQAMKKEAAQTWSTDNKVEFRGS